MTARSQDQPQERQEKQEPQEAPQFVQWTGDPVTGAKAAEFEERVITAKQVRDAYGVDLPSGVRELRWDRRNSHRVPVSDLTPELVEILTKQEASFKVTDKAR